MVNPKLTIRDLQFLICNLLVICSLLLGIYSASAQEEEEKKELEPIVVNGDTVEYSPETKNFTASGNVLVIYQGTKLSCQKLTLNSATKDCQAEGEARLDDGKGIIEGAKLTYNFQTKKGTIFNAGFRSNPYFGRAEKLNKVNEDQFVTYRSYMSTCNYDIPHWRMKSKKVNFFPGDKVQLKENKFCVAKTPLLYLPQYNHSLKDPLMHIQMMPGKSKEWGSYLLTASRYSLTEDLKGRIYLDYRSNFGNAQGFGTNYTSEEFGHGDFKLYYTQERDKSRDVSQDVNVPKVFQRYLVQLRHQALIPGDINLYAEYNRLIDSKRVLMGPTFNLLKDYFPRQYDRDTKPLSYLSAHRSFRYASIDFLFQKRVNPWYEQEEKLPQIQYNLPSIPLGKSPFYIGESASFANTKQKAAAPAENDDTPTRSASHSISFSLPLKIAFIDFSPGVSSSQSFSDKGAYGSTLDIGLSGSSGASTKFYRIFNLNTNLLGLDLHGLRHIITPSLSYSYGNNTSSKIGQWEIGGHRSTRTSSATFALENRLQTKRDGEKVDIFYFLINSGYTFKGTGHKGSLSDFKLKSEFLPYTWMSLYSDAIYLINTHYFSEVTYDLNYKLSEERTFSLGQRYAFKGNNVFTYQLNWRINPKWKISFYHRLNRGSDTAAKTGLREQEYRLTRDFHCWTMDLSYNTTRGKGDAIWLVFRLKAFPELEFEYNKSYHAPKPGSQSERNR